MGRKHRNRKKAKDQTQISNSQLCTTKSSDVLKEGKGKDNTFETKEIGVKVLQDYPNPSGKYKFEKHDVPDSVHPNVYQASAYESSAYYCGESDDESVCYPNVYQASAYESSAYYCGESDDESVCSTSDFFKPIFEPKNNLEGKVMKEKVFSSINQYKDSKASFSKIYHRWIPERENTLEKLRSLLKEIHDNTTNYYKTQATFKDISYNSRRFKETTENQTMDFFASLAAFVSDAASGITSFAQAFEVDSYQNRLQEIMDHDAEITKDLYASRSQCVSQYEGIEEVIRKFNPNTLTTTVDKISGTLLVHKHWAAMKNAYEEDNMSKLLDEVSRFFDNACQSEVLQNVGASVSRFVTDNPAALDACKSTGRAVYGAIDAFSEKNRDRNAAIGYVNKATNLYLMLEDKKEVDHLRSIIDGDTHQSKLESEVEEAIDSLEEELREMRGIYFRLFNIYDSD